MLHTPLTRGRGRPRGSSSRRLLGSGFNQENPVAPNNFPEENIESNNSLPPCRSPSPQRRSRSSPGRVEFMKTRSRTNALRLFDATANSNLTPENQVIAPAPQSNQRIDNTSQVSPRDSSVMDTNRDESPLLDPTPGPSFQATNVPQIPVSVPHLAATGPRIREYVP